ncbi:MAG: AAA family ATPase [Deltaproteobacteria bacterium]|nr:AAA family ATPase [Deltaproteobacteria bacterium]
MKRRITEILVSRLNSFRAIALLGPRQVGKSYLLKEIVKRHDGTLLSFDDPVMRAEAAKDPLKYLKQRYNPGRYLFIDEAAKVPEIFNAREIISYYGGLKRHSQAG